MFGSSHAAGSAMPGHRHLAPYMAWVMRGRFQEKSPEGCFDCEVGTLAFRPAYHAHADVFAEEEAFVANALLDESPVDEARVYRLEPNDRLKRIFANDPAAFAQIALERAEPIAPKRTPDWVASFLAAVCGSTRSVEALAKDAGVSPEHATRSIVKWYGLPPRALRAEPRMRMALEQIAIGASLAGLAAELGFADQAHMTRAVKRATGFTPKALAKRTAMPFANTHTPRF